MDSNKIIDALGGTGKVAELCGLTTGAVSQWRKSKNGIPRSWAGFLELKRPDVDWAYLRGTAPQKEVS